MGDDSTDALLSVLAATAPGGAVLYLGNANPGLISKLLAGMDITTRLLVASDDAALVSTLREELTSDLRLNLHFQPLAEFLTDIAAHRFALVLIAADAGPVRQQALELLGPGGIGVGLKGAAMPARSASWLRCELRSADIDWLVSMRARPLPKRRRRQSRAVGS